jgi:hypothetical protein
MTQKQHKMITDKTFSEDLATSAAPLSGAEGSSVCYPMNRPPVLLRFHLLVHLLDPLNIFPCRLLPAGIA